MKLELSLYHEGQHLSRVAELAQDEDGLYRMSLSSPWGPLDLSLGAPSAPEAEAEPAVIAEPIAEPAVEPAVEAPAEPEPAEPLPAASPKSGNGGAKKP
jgi:uncharacterized membrane protein